MKYPYYVVHVSGRFGDASAFIAVENAGKSTLVYRSGGFRKYGMNEQQVLVEIGKKHWKKITAEEAERLLDEK